MKLLALSLLLILSPLLGRGAETPAPTTPTAPDQREDWSAMRSDQEFHDPFAQRDDQAAPKTSDPLEPMNRAFFKANDRLYFWVLKPVAKGYSKVAPGPFRDS